MARGKGWILNLSLGKNHYDEAQTKLFVQLLLYHAIYHYVVLDCTILYHTILYYTILYHTYATRSEVVL